MVVMIAFIVKGNETIRRYLEYRVRMAEARGIGGDRNVVQAIQELRAEVSALKQHEAEAVLSFDSTLQTLDARVKHLERRALSQGAGERTPVGAGASAEEAARLTARGS